MSQDQPYGKHRASPPGASFFPIEAAGLAWLRVPGGPPLPAVRAVDDAGITLERIAAGQPTPQAARELGRGLARMHAAGAPAFGAPPPGVTAESGWIGDLPMPYANRRSFAHFWATDRLAYTALIAHDRGGLTTTELRAVQRFSAELLSGQREIGPEVSPARVHGDLWAGNVVWGADGRAWLIDPAAHGGHPESDLAMLALFGCPHLDQIRRGYHDVAELPAGWRDRIGLHQAWPLLVHAALFGGTYGAEAVAALMGKG